MNKSFTGYLKKRLTRLSCCFFFLNKSYLKQRMVFFDLEILKINNLFRFQKIFSSHKNKAKSITKLCLLKLQFFTDLFHTSA